MVTSLENPFGMLMFGLLFVGKPVPLHVPESVQPEIRRLAGLTPGPPGCCRSAITSTMLFAQSPVLEPKRQFGAGTPFTMGVGIVTIDGLVMPPKEFPTL